MNRLTEEILASCEWRNSELENLKKIGIVTFNSQKQKVKEQYFRMCIPYIYAHWEGFIVESFKLLITYLNSLNLNKDLVIENIYTFSLLNTLKPLSGKQSFEQCSEFINKFTCEYGKKLFIPPSSFTTKSNLTYKQLLIIFKWFGMINNCSRFEFNINRLVIQRNRIAHGENGIIIQYKDIEEFCETLQKIFDILVVTFDDYLNNESYLKPRLLLEL